MVSLKCFVEIILPAVLWPWGRLNLYQKLVPGIFPGGVKAASASVWLPYHLHVPIFMKSGSFNLLEPWEPVQTCTRIARPLPLPVRSKKPYFLPLILVQDKENGLCEEEALVAPCEAGTVLTLDTRSKPLHVLANIVGDEAYSLMHAAFLYGSFKPEGSMSMSLLLGSRLFEESRCVCVPQ